MSCLITAGYICKQLVGVGWGGERRDRVRSVGLMLLLRAGEIGKGYKMDKEIRRGEKKFSFIKI